jgi:hypothetical protein
MDSGRGNWRGLATEGDPHKEAGGYQGDEEHSEGDHRVVWIVQPWSVIVDWLDFLRRSEDEEGGGQP